MGDTKYLDLCGQVKLGQNSTILQKIYQYCSTLFQNFKNWFFLKNIEEKTQITQILSILVKVC